jgi:hypothetical protein
MLGSCVQCTPDAHATCRSHLQQTRLSSSTQCTPSNQCTQAALSALLTAVGGAGCDELVISVWVLALLCAHDVHVGAADFAVSHSVGSDGPAMPGARKSCAIALQEAVQHRLCGTLSRNARSPNGHTESLRQNDLSACRALTRSACVSKSAYWLHMTTHACAVIIAGYS